MCHYPPPHHGLQSMELNLHLSIVTKAVDVVAVVVRMESMGNYFRGIEEKIPSWFLLSVKDSLYLNLATSHLLGPVPAVVNEEAKASNGIRGGGDRGYQTLGPPIDIVSSILIFQQRIS